MKASTCLLHCVVTGVCLVTASAASHSVPSPQVSESVVANNGGQQSHEGPTNAITFLVVAMVLGVFTYHLLSFTRIPYTVLLLVRPCPSSECAASKPNDQKQGSRILGVM